MADHVRHLEQYHGIWIPLLTPFSEKSEILHKFLSSRIEYFQSFPYISTIVFFSPLGEGNLLSWHEKAMILHSLRTKPIRLRKVVYIDELTDINKLDQFEIHHKRDYDSLLLDLKVQVSNQLDQTISPLILSLIENHIPFYVKLHAIQSPIIYFLQEYKTNPILHGFLLDESISFSEIQQLINLFPDKLFISSQESAHLLNLEHGVHSIFSSLTNIYPDLLNNFIETFHHNNHVLFTLYHSLITELNTLIEPYSYSHAIKYIWYLFGQPLIESRDPKKLTEPEKSQLKDHIAKFRKQYQKINL